MSGIDVRRVPPVTQRIEAHKSGGGKEEKKKRRKRRRSNSGPLASNRPAAPNAYQEHALKEVGEALLPPEKIQRDGYYTASRSLMWCDPHQFSQFTITLLSH